MQYISFTESPSGPDDGIDLLYKDVNNYIIVQVKHYKNKNSLITKLKNEINKVSKLRPKEYYICCSTLLSPNDRIEIFNFFKEYMQSTSNIYSYIELDELLQQEDYSKIIRKNYKLWLTSTNILSEINNNDIFIDCESLLCDIENNKNFFVDTKAYDVAKNHLEQNHIIMLLGDPGVGKTTLSKMLVLYFAANGYRIRFTTEVTNIAALKKAISANPEFKEVILLDDCFGQYYFAMKNSQENELLALIRYIKTQPNKKLILNSRITIYNEAINKNHDFEMSIENKEFQVYRINMNNITLLDKAKILYNHLYFSNIDNEYWYAILKRKTYLSIIRHENYNPRLIEYICNQAKKKSIAPNNYLNFINETLANPQEIWKNEYERRLKEEDKILLNTIFSLSTVEVNENDVKKAFYSRIKLNPKFDTTNDLYTTCLARLNNNLIKQIDINNEKYLAAANPSINDFLNNYLNNNVVERDKIIESSTHINQLIRLLSNLQLNNEIVTRIQDNSIEQLIFTNEYQKNGIIVYYLMKNDLKLKNYKKYITNFLANPTAIYVTNHILFSIEEILITIFSSTAFCFYQLEKYIIKNIEKIFNQIDFYKLDIVIQQLLTQKTNINNLYSLLAMVINQSINENFYSVEASNYESDIDINEILRDHKYDAISYELSNIIEEFNQKIKNIVQEEIMDLLNKLPEQILERIDDFSYYPVDISESEKVIESYIYDRDYVSTPDNINQDDIEINHLFMKHPIE